MGIKNRIYPGYLYFLTLTVVDWVDLFSGLLTSSAINYAGGKGLLEVILN